MYRKYIFLFLLLITLFPLSRSTVGASVYLDPADQTQVTWANQNGLTRNRDLVGFGYDRSVSREEAAKILSKATADIFGKKYASFPENCNTPYKDDSTFDTTLKNDIYTACALDIMHGNSGIFNPKGTLKKSEALAIIMRAVDGGKKDESGSIWYQVYADRSRELGLLGFSNFGGFNEAITRGELIEWLHMVSDNLSNKSNPLSETKWKLDSYNSKAVSGKYTLAFDAKNRLSAKFCNGVGGEYTLSGKILSAPMLISTMMYCEGESMPLENNFQLNKATYTISEDTFTLTTESGNIYIWKR
ncbi:META domain-containing protein [Candidatus Gracilibacteria bacterium]|nr:META domain-containing protein [Candidatus Gracilibacteria bacterium]